MSNPEKIKTDPASLEARIAVSSKGDPALYDAEASHLRKQQLLAKARVENLLIKYLSLAMGTNENLAKTLEELDKIEIQARMEIDRAIAEHGEDVFTTPEIDHLMGQFKKHRPTESNVFPDEPAVPVRTIQQETPEIIDPPLSSYDKLESSWLTRKMSKWLFNRKEETTERVVREARQARGQENIQTKQREQSLMESYREERPGKLIFASGAGEHDEVKKESTWQKAKNWGKKVFTRFAFLTAGFSSMPINTADTNLPPVDGKKIVVENQITPTKNTEGVLKTHAEIIAENPNIAPVAKTKKSLNADTVKETGSTAVDSFDTSVLPTMKEVLEQRNIDSAEFIAKTNPDTILQTPVGQSVDTIVSKNTHVKDTIEKLTPAPLKKIETKADTAKTDTGVLKNFVQNLDKKEKEAQDQKIAKTPEKETKHQEPNTINQSPDWTAPKPTPTSELNHPTTAPEAVGLWSAGANPNVFDTPSVSGGIKVTYQDKSGNVLDTNAMNKTPEIIYTPMPPKTPEKPTEVKTPETKQASRAPELLIGKKQKNPTVSSSAISGQEIIDRTTTLPSFDSIDRSQDFVVAKDTVVSIDTLGTPTNGEGVHWNFQWSNYHPHEGNTLITVDTPLKRYWESDQPFQVRDAEARKIEGGYEMPYSLWLRLDTVLLDAFKNSPEAMLRYIANAKDPGSHDTYPIIVWNGNEGIEYIVGKNDLLAATPQKMLRGEKSLPTRFDITVTNSPNGKKFLINNEPIESYIKLDRDAKTSLNFISAENGTDAFSSFSVEEGAGGNETQKQVQDVINFIWDTQKVTWEKKAVEYAESGTRDYDQKQTWHVVYKTPAPREEATIVLRQKEQKKNTASKKIQTGTQKKISRIFNREKNPQRKTQKKNMKRAQESKTDTFKVYKYEQE